MLSYRTAGGGGWKDPLDRPVEKVVADVRKGLVSVHKARSDYGVVIDPRTLEADVKATEELRAKVRAERGPVRDFDFGPPLEEILARCREDQGLEPPEKPRPLPWVRMETPEEAMARVRRLGDRQVTQTE